MMVAADATAGGDAGDDWCRRRCADDAGPDAGFSALRLQEPGGAADGYEMLKDVLFPDNPFICRTPSTTIIDMQGENIFTFYDASIFPPVAGSRDGRRQGSARRWWRRRRSTKTRRAAAVAAVAAERE